MCIHTSERRYVDILFHNFKDAWAVKKKITYHLGPYSIYISRLSIIPQVNIESCERTKCYGAVTITKVEIDEMMSSRKIFPTRYMNLSVT